MSRNVRKLVHPFHGLPTLPTNPRTAEELASQGQVLVKFAVALAHAVRDSAPADVHAALGELDRQQLTALTIALAAMRDPAGDTRESLVWTEGLEPEPILALAEVGRRAS